MDLSYKNWCITDVIKETKFNYTWTIKNYTMFDDVINSSTFPVGANNKADWYLSLHPNGEDNKKVNVSLNLVLKSCNTEVKVSFKCSILNAKGNEIYKKETGKVCRFTRSQTKWGFPDFISRIYLLNKSNGFLSDNNLTIICKVTVLSDIVNTLSNQSNVMQVPEYDLIEFLENLLNKKEFCDVTLAVGEREFQAHKAVLAARSDVFAAMFKYDMKELRLNRVSITDLNEEVFNEMLRFIYTGKAPNLSKMCDELLMAADKYGLKNLKMMCEKEFCDNLSVETAAKTLVLADRHNAEQLKALTINFIKANVFQVLESEGYQNMFEAHSHLITEAFKPTATQERPAKKIFVFN